MLTNIAIENKKNRSCETPIQYIGLKVWKKRVIYFYAKETND